MTRSKGLGIWLWPVRIVAFALLIFALMRVDSQLVPLLKYQDKQYGYHEVIFISAGVAVILAVSLNLINGITGQFSLGHAGFMAVGAYVSAYFTKEIGGQMVDPLNFTIGILLGALAAGLAGLVVGLPSLRLRGDYLAIVTLGFNQIIISLIRNIPKVGGASGYHDIPKFTTVSWVLGMVFLCILCVRNLADSQFGREMRAVREDEVAAEATGVNTTKVKVLAFVISAMWAGVAGALQAHFIQGANPGDFTFMRSVEVVVSVVLGGLGSITGAALAAAGLAVLQEVLRNVPGVFWTGICLAALAAYWSYGKHALAIKRRAIAVVSWLIGPLILVALLFIMKSWPSLAPVLNARVSYFSTHPLSGDWFVSNKGALRYIIYSLILIILMLLRPQGLLGRAELSFRRRRRTA